jgi:hypothetical protein
VLDIGCCDGLVAYEFARSNAAIIHGFDKDPADLLFAKRLFRDVPVESRFVEANLAISGAEFERRHGDKLLPEYDTVLFLGVYHHLARQAEHADLDDLVDFLLGRTRRRFAVRTKQIGVVEPQILAGGFVESGEEYPACAGMGPLRIYERQV